MRNISFKKHEIELILVILSIIALIFYTLRFTTIFDENYTLVLIHNSFSNIIKFDSLDVHPPLYYFLLKIFLGVTTFWTNSFLTKIFFARVFSVIISVITFVFLFKISKELGIKNNILVQWLLFLLTPGIISFTYEFIKIRMYSMGALFVVIEFYELIRYDDNSYTDRLIYATLMSILASYTNYYAAFIAGTLLIIYFLKYLLKHNKNCLKIFISGLLTMISFLPWVPILLKQLSLQVNHPQGGFLKQWIASLILILLFIYPLHWCRYNLNYKLDYYFNVSFYASIILFLFMSIISFVDQSVFQFRYFYPIFVIYSFLGLNILFVNNKSCVPKILLVFLGLICIGAYSNQLRYYGTLSINIVKQFHKWKFHKRNVIYLKQINNTDQGFNSEKMIYLSRIGKYFNMPKNVDYINNNVSYHNLFKKVNNRRISTK